MTSTDPHSPPAPSAPSAKRPLVDPEKLAMVGLIGCLVLGAGLVYWLVFGSGPKRRVIAVDPAEQTGGLRIGDGPRGGRGAGATGIQKGAGDTWAVRGAVGGMRVTRGGDGGYQFTYQFLGASSLPPDQLKLHAGAVRLRRDAAMAQQWGVSPEQVEQIRKLNLTREAAFEPGQPERDAIATAWSAYAGATGDGPRAKAGQKVIEKLDAVAKANLEPARQALAQRLDAVRKILTPEQVQRITGAK